MGRRGKLVEEERGAAMVEFAIIVPLLIMLLIGIVQFGLVLNTQISLTGAAREGARVMAITNDWPAAEAATIAAAPSLNSPPSVTRSPASCTPGDEIAVTAAQTDSFDIPFVGPFSIDLTGTGVMRCGG